MSEQIESSHVQVTNEKVSQGLQFRFIMQENLAKKILEDWVNPDVEHLKERKYLNRTPVALLITEKGSVVNFRRKNGDMNIIGYFGSEERFHKWTRDLFMYYWERAEKWTPSTIIV